VYGLRKTVQSEELPVVHRRACCTTCVDDGNVECDIIDLALVVVEYMRLEKRSYLCVCTRGFYVYAAVGCVYFWSSE
jgi:hypothetical protein